MSQEWDSWTELSLYLPFTLAFGTARLCGDCLVKTSSSIPDQKTALICVLVELAVWEALANHVFCLLKFPIIIKYTLSPLYKHSSCSFQTWKGHKSLPSAPITKKNTHRKDPSTGGGKGGVVNILLLPPVGSKLSVSATPTSTWTRLSICGDHPVLSLLPAEARSLSLIVCWFLRAIIPKQLLSLLPSGFSFPFPSYEAALYIVGPGVFVLALAPSEWHIFIVLACKGAERKKGHPVLFINLTWHLIFEILSIKCV